MAKNERMAKELAGVSSAAPGAADKPHRIARLVRSAARFVRDLKPRYGIPLVRRRIVALVEGSPEILTYYYSLRNRAVVQSIEALPEAAGRDRLRPLPDASFIIPWRQYLRAELAMPDMPAHEIAGAIPYQLSSRSPFGPEEIVYVDRSRTAENSGPTATTVDYSHLGAIQKQIHRVTASGVFPLGVYSDDHLWEELIGRCVQQQMGAEAGTYLYMRFARDWLVVGIGGAPGASAPKAVPIRSSGPEATETMYNAALSLITAQREKLGRLHFSHVFVLGQTPAAESFLERYAGSLPAPVERLSPESLMRCFTEARIESKTDRQLSASYLPVLLRPARLLPALVPPAVFQSGLISRYLWSHARYLAAFVLAFLLVIAATMEIRLIGAEQRLEALQEEASLLAPAFRNLSRIQAELNRRQAAQTSTSTSLDLLYHLVAAKPADLFFTSVDYVRSNRISLSGYTLSASSPVTYVKALKQTGRYGDVELKFVSRRGQGETERIEYRIEVLLGKD